MTWPISDFAAKSQNVRLWRCTQGNYSEKALVVIALLDGGGMVFDGVGR